jgi:DeoR/GlpR family transcriptional regulator of sugar metabolism
MKNERQIIIKKFIEDHKKITIDDICSICSVSPETARRDLNELEQTGFIKRVYGGARLLDNNTMPNLILPWDSRHVSDLQEKQAMSRELIALIPDHSTIALDSGTTILELAKLLNQKKDLTILVNDLRTAIELCTNTTHTVYFIGGGVKRDDLITTGLLANSFLDYFSQIDISIISGDGFDIDGGMTDYNVEMGILKVAMIKKSKKVFAAIASRKFSVKAFYKVCNAKDCDVIITSSKTPSQTIEAIKNCGVKTIVCSM